MTSLIRRILRRLKRPRVLNRTVISGVTQRRRAEPAGAQVHVLTGGLDALREQLARLSPQLFAGFGKDERIFIKLNLNTADPYPASTDPEMLRALLTVLRGAGFTRLYAGDCASNPALPTRRVARATGIEAAAKGLCELKYLDEGRYLSLATGGAHLPEVTVSEAAFGYDRLIYLGNVKSHRWADFSLGMKLVIGFMHPRERVRLHRDHLQEKVAELADCIEPDLVILDARRAFVTGGPSSGDLADGNALILSRDLLAADLAAYRLLLGLKRAAGSADGFSDDPFGMRQFAHLRALRAKGAGPA